MNRYHLTHVTEFHYDGPVSESYNEVRLRPMHDDVQSCLSFRLTTSPVSRTTAYRDAFGNWVHQFNVLSLHRHLKVQADCVVLAQEHIFQSNGAPLGELDSQREEIMDEFYDFVAPTEYVPHLSALDDFIAISAERSDGTMAGFAQAASDTIHERLEYVKGATHVRSSIKDSLSVGAGVCQDFAHVLLGVARKRGLPARYVSGYMVPQGTAEPDARLEEVIGGQASHAWAEVYIPGSGWMPLDPTLGKAVGLRHVRLAYGRDYGDVAPVRGVYSGHAGQRLSVDVRVCPALDDEGHERLSETAAGPLKPASPDDRTQQPAQQQ
jgi:transglutaminase-like putative cysteine protease